MRFHEVSRWAFSIGSVFALVSYVSSSSAGDREDADRLYQEAIKDMDAGKYAEACPKLERSQSLDPALGTQFELASCYEHVERPVAAWELFQRVADFAHQAGKSKLEERARAKLAATAATLPRVRIVARSLPPSSTVLVDGKPRDASELALEPGTHTVTVESPSTLTWRQTFEAKKGATVDLALGPFQPRPTAIDPRRTDPEPDAPRKAESKRSALAYVGLGAAGLGAVAVGVGLGFGAAASAKNDESKAAGQCGADNRCTTSGLALRNSAYDAATVSTVATVGGALVAAGGLGLFLFAPKSEVRVGVVPSRADGVTATLTGTF